LRKPARKKDSCKRGVKSKYAKRLGEKNKGGDEGRKVRKNIGLGGES